MLTPRVHNQIAILSAKPSRLMARIVLATAGTLLLAGCGNQMFRQPSYQPLDTPRAQESAQSVQVAVDERPTDGRPVTSPAWGDKTIAEANPYASSFPSREPDLPGPNLSDNARNEPAPAAVDAIVPPIALDNAHLVSGGHLLFLNRCVQCHNASGYGYGTVGQYLLPHPPDLASPLVQNIKDGALYWHITMGQGKMPGFRHWTTPSERWALAAYVRSLKGVQPGTNLQAADTRLAPYPVYGQVGYENGRSAGPYKVLPGESANIPTEANLRVHVDKGIPPQTSGGGFGSFDR